MLEIIDDLPPHVEGLDAVETVTREDYESVMVPLLEKARIAGRTVRLLYRFGPRFSAFTPGAAWQDLRVGIHYLRLFEKCAVVSDHQWLLGAVRVVAACWPCPIRTFSLDELDQAAQWLESPSDARNLAVGFRPECGVLVVEPKGPLTREDFQYLASQADPIIERHDLHGLVIHAPHFPGWENLGSLISHAQFVRDHHRELGRVAVAADGSLPELAPRLAAHFVKAEVRHFPYADLEAAIQWASGPDHTRSKSSGDGLGQ